METDGKQRYTAHRQPRDGSGLPPQAVESVTGPVHASITDVVYLTSLRRTAALSVHSLFFAISHRVLAFLPNSCSRKSVMRILQRDLANALLVTLLFACPTGTRAQQSPPAPEGQDSPSAPGQDSPESQANSDADRPATNSLDTGQSVDGHNRVLSPMRVNHFSVLSFSTFYLFDSNSSLQPSISSSSDVYAARTLLLYSLGGDRSGLDVQYQPYLYFFQADNEVSAHLDSLLGIHAFRKLSARWLFNLNELFYYSPNSGSQIDPTIAVNAVTGEISLRPFVGLGYRTLNNHVVASFEDHLNEQDTVSLHADYNYSQVSSGNASANSSPTSVQGFQSENTVGLGVAWTHEWHQDQWIGLAYNYNHQILSNANAENQYHSVLVTYSEKIRPTLLLQLAGGPSLQLHGNNSPKTVTFIGNASVQKTFRSSFLVLSFARNYNFNGVPTDSYYDRYDGFYSQNLGRRWVFSFGGAYIRQNSTVASQLTGHTVWAGPAYFLNEKWSVVAQFADSAFAGGLQPNTSRYLVSAGLHWSAMRERGTPP
jgi:hypothetical protein